MRCVCGHIQALHCDGVCFAVLNPCGCRQFETEEDADKPECDAVLEYYTGRYHSHGPYVW